MLDLQERRDLERCLKLRERGILTDEEAAGSLNLLVRPDNLDAVLAELPPALIEPLKQQARARPGGYYWLHGPLPEESWRRLAEAGCVILYSLLPDNRPNAHEGLDRFHGYPVLGHLLVSDPKAVAEVAVALRAGAEEGTRGRRCWMPHHGVRAVGGAGPLDLVICFTCECLNWFPSPEGDAFEWADVSERPQALIDRLLRESGGARGVSRPRLTARCCGFGPPWRSLGTRENGAARCAELGR